MVESDSKLNVAGTDVNLQSNLIVGEHEQTQGVKKDDKIEGAGDYTRTDGTAESQKSTQASATGSPVRRVFLTFDENETRF